MHIWPVILMKATIITLPWLNWLKQGVIIYIQSVSKVNLFLLRYNKCYILLYSFYNFKSKRVSTSLVEKNFLTHELLYDKVWKMSLGQQGFIICGFNKVYVYYLTFILSNHLLCKDSLSPLKLFSVHDNIDAGTWNGTPV